MDFDWKSAIQTVAPMAAGMLGGPMAAGAVKVLADKLLGGSTGDQVKDEAALQEALAGGLTPEIKAKLIEADNAIKIAMIAAQTRKEELAVDVEKSYISDVANARSANANTVGILRLGYFINFASYAAIILVLFGCYWLVSGKAAGPIDPGIAAVVGGIVGSVVQWLFGNASQANGFFFGSSPQARANSAALAASVSQAAQTKTTEK